MKEYVICQEPVGIRCNVYKRVCKWLPLYKKVNTRPLSKRLDAVEYVKKQALDKDRVEVENKDFGRKWLWIK